MAAQESEHTKYLTLSTPTDPEILNNFLSFLESSSFQIKHHVQSAVRSILTTDDLADYLKKLPFITEYGLSITKQTGSEIILSGCAGWKYCVSLSADKQAIDISFVANVKS